MAKEALARILLLLLLWLSPATVLSQATPTATKRKDVCQLVAATDSLPRGRSLAIRLFSIKSRDLYRTDTGQPFYTAESLESLRLALAAKLRTQLQQTKYFRSIVISRDDEPPQTDLVLEGEFTVIYQLGGKVQLMAYPVTRMAINARFKPRETAQRMIAFTCFAASEAGLLNRPKKQMHKNIEKITAGMKTLLAGHVK